MIKLTNETKTIEDSKFLKDKSKIGTKVDNSYSLSIVDENNIVLKRGEKTLAYYGDIHSAFKRGLSIAIKGSTEALSLEKVLETIDSFHKAVDELKTKEK